ncbi:MAG TPA: DUF1080 domain-containing protein [Bryobacteraceae bacterium]|nr:DUF1080 domain-containing protein [Bryobacteraceae bacterium]
MDLRMSKAITPVLMCGAVLLVPGLLLGQEAKPATTTGEWHALFDGKTLDGWKESDFLGAGKVTVGNGVITIGSGVLTGINWAGPSLPFPASGYEVRIEAARMQGADFFAGITFPVRDSFCTWINGGWGGEVAGLSSIDGADASRNETTFGRTFELGRWYTLRLRVTPSRISAWIDDELVIDVSIEKKWIALREGDIDRSIPFGIATYATVGAVRKIEWRSLEPGNK